MPADWHAVGLAATAAAAATRAASEAAQGLGAWRESAALWSAAEAIGATACLLTSSGEVTGRRQRPRGNRAGRRCAEQSGRRKSTERKLELQKPKAFGGCVNGKEELNSGVGDEVEVQAKDANTIGGVRGAVGVRAPVLSALQQPRSLVTQVPVPALRGVAERALDTVQRAAEHAESTKCKLQVRKQRRKRDVPPTPAMQFSTHTMSDPTQETRLQASMKDVKDVIAVQCPTRDSCVQTVGGVAVDPAPQSQPAIATAGGSGSVCTSSENGECEDPRASMPRPDFVAVQDCDELTGVADCVDMLRVVRNVAMTQEQIVNLCMDHGLSARQCYAACKHAVYYEVLDDSESD